MRSVPAKLGLSIAIGYAAILGLVGLLYRSFLYPAPKTGLEPHVRGAALWRLAGDPASGAGEVVALFASPKGEQPVIVFFHGNGEELVDLAVLGRELVERGFGILFVEYPGYGLAAGQETSEQTIYAAADRALDELAAAGFGENRVVLVGQSLGSGAAVEMAVRGRGCRLVLVSPFTSVVDMVQRFVPIVPASALVRDRFDNLAKAPAVGVPTLVVHGDKDPLVPLDMGKRVAEAIPGARLEVFEGTGHNDIWQRGRLVDLLVATATARLASDDRPRPTAN